MMVFLWCNETKRWSFGNSTDFRQAVSARRLSAMGLNAQYPLKKERKQLLRSRHPGESLPLTGGFRTRQISACAFRKAVCEIT
jgi:hypothetical protein